MHNPAEDIIPDLPPFPDTLFDALQRDGYAVLERWMPESLRDSLYQEALRLYEHGAMKPAAIGQGRDKHVDRTERSDHIRWLDPQNSGAQYRFLEWMAHYRQELNRRFYFGINNYEAHFAVYPKGSFYNTHYDNFRGRNRRIVTTVWYLNPEWRAEWGGELIIYDAQKQKLRRVLPAPGTLVTFLSEALPHEVRPVTQPRVSIAGWMRRDDMTAV